MNTHRLYPPSPPPSDHPQSLIHRPIFPKLKFKSLEERGRRKTKKKKKKKATTKKRGAFAAAPLPLSNLPQSLSLFSNPHISNPRFFSNSPNTLCFFHNSAPFRLRPPAELGFRAAQRRNSREAESSEGF
ncbi:hypothetical protein ACLB2K_002831 [Fragaria x ananassa]